MAIPDGDISLTTVEGGKLTFPHFAKTLTTLDADRLIAGVRCPNDVSSVRLQSQICNTQSDGENWFDAGV